MKKNLIQVFVLVIASLAGALHLCAAPGDLDLSFDPGSGIATRPVDQSASTPIVQPDGRIIINGGFTSVNGLAQRSLARLTADGSGDPSFRPALSGTRPSVFPAYVKAVALQPDGKVLIAGDFAEVSGLARKGIARLNSDGSLDVTFDAGGRVEGAVQLLVLQPDGKVLIAGSLGGASPKMARLNSDGTVDSSFVLSGELLEKETKSMVLQPDGKVLASLAGSDGQQIVRLNSDGSVDESFHADAEGEVSRLVLQPDGKVLLGGSLGRVNGIARNNIARLHPDGTLDETFDNTDLAQGNVRSIAVQSSGKVLIAGEFIRVEDGTEPRMARLNEDGTLDEIFHPEFAWRNGKAFLSSITLQPDGKILVFGYFNSVNEIHRSYMARLTSDGSLDASFNAGSAVDSQVLAVKTLTDGKVLIGGDFPGVQGLIRPGIARLDVNGTVDPDFNSTIIPYPHNDDAREYHVWGLLIQPDSKILVAFNDFSPFDTPEGTYNLARLNADGSMDSGFHRVQGASFAFPLAGALALQANGQVLIGGHFTAINGVAKGGFARLNQDGILDASFDVRFTTLTNNPFVRGLAVQPDGKLIIAGRFATVNGTSRANVARLNADGTVDPSFDPGAGVAGGVVLTEILQPDGKVLLGGTFTNVNGVARSAIARLNAEGALDTSFDPGAGPPWQVYAMALQPDGKVVIAFFRTGQGTGLQRLNGDGSLDANFNPMIHGGLGQVFSLTLQADGRLVVGGEFSGVNGFPRNYVARVFWSDAAILVSGPVKQSGDFVTRFKGTPGFAYTIESSASLSSAAWQKLSNQTAPTNDLGSGVGVFELRDQIGPEGQRFYRTVYPAY